MLWLSGSCDIQWDWSIMVPMGPAFLLCLGHFAQGLMLLLTTGTMHEYIYIVKRWLHAYNSNRHPLSAQ